MNEGAEAASGRGLRVCREMRITAEIRWFWPGRPPSAFAEWFTAAGPSWGNASEARTRTTYLRDHAESALGIKKRGDGDGVEIKGLIS